MAQKSNYALISALYSNETKGLYSDIYFPIIKYSIVKIFSRKELENSYSSADAVNEFIKDKFGIDIPIIVIAKSILKISKFSKDIAIETYEKGNTFRILHASFTDEVNVDGKEQLFSSKLGQIETAYQQFLDEQGCYNDHVSFLQFITDNTDDILGYFENEDSSKVDEKYATLIFFLQFLHDNGTDLYVVANQLFWSSIIVAFLTSERPSIEDTHEGIKTEFFLDTSIVMGLLDLSNPLREIYSKEVCEIIKSSGGILRVNPITLEEIKYILSSVETHGPNPTTDIASACERRNLSSNDLAQIRLHLERLVEDKGINVFPQMSNEEKYKIKNSYKGKKIIQLLGEYRSKNPDSYSSDNFREIHDIYMDDFIRLRRKAKSGIEFIYFLTANVDLISFCKLQHPSANYMISTGKVILDLWMHNAKPIDISSCALTETMAHCLDLHSVKVRSKIVEVSRYYNKTKDNFDPLVYRDFIHKLYHRAKNVIVTVETNPDNEVQIGNSWGKLIQDAVKADNLHYNETIAKANNEKSKLLYQLASQNDELQRVHNAFLEIKERDEQKQERINGLSSHNDKLQKQLSVKEDILKQRENEIKVQLQAKLYVEQLVKLHERKELLSVEVSKLKKQILPLENERRKSFCNWKPWLLNGIALFLIFAAILVFVLDFIKVFSLETYQYWICGSSIAIALFLFNRASALNDKIEIKRKETYAKWERHHLYYGDKLDRLNELSEELANIDKKIKIGNMENAKFYS